MEHEVKFRAESSNRENGPTFLDFPLFPEIFQSDEPTKRFPFSTEPKFPKILFTFSSNILDFRRSLWSYLNLARGTKTLRDFVAARQPRDLKSSFHSLLKQVFCCETCFRGQFVASQVQ